MSNKPTAPKLRIRLNLLYPQGLPQNIGVKLSRLVLTYGRVILILVELVVLATFGMRFKLDAELSDLKDNIDQQVPLIQLLAGDEALIKHTQFKLDLIKKTLNATPLYQQMAQKMSTITPLGIKFNTFSIDSTQPPLTTFRILGEASSNSDLSIFLNNLKTDKNLQDVTLNNISLNEGIVIFTISGTIKS